MVFSGDLFLLYCAKRSPGQRRKMPASRATIIPNGLDCQGTYGLGAPGLTPRDRN